MKTSIAHNNNVSLSKGILISAYIHNSAAYVLLDGNRGYILRAENQEEEERIAAFVDQLQIGAYVFAYLTYNEAFRHVKRHGTGLRRRGRRTG